MRILQVSHNYHITGGSDSVFFATCDLLESTGHSVIPFCIAHPQNFPTKWAKYFPEGSDTGSRSLVNGARYFYNTDARTKLKNLLADVGEIDLAHFHIYHGKHTPAILPILRARGIPIVHSLHEYKLACPVYTMLRQGSPCDLCLTGSDANCIRHACKNGSYLQSLIMTAEKITSRFFGDVRLIDRFLCVSEFQRQTMLRAGLPADRLFTLHNFVAGAKNPQYDHRGYYLYAGRIEELKGIPTLIKAFKSNGRRLLIAGAGSWSTEMKEMIQGTNNIEHLGFQGANQMQDLIAHARAVIVPSEWNENCPMAVLEAKAQGRPVIGANIGGIPELIRHGIDGMLFEAGDVDGLIEAIHAFEKLKYRTLTKNSCEDANTRFSKQKYGAELLGHYHDVIEGGNCLKLQSA